MFVKCVYVVMKIENEIMLLMNKLCGVEVGYENVKVVFIVV